MTYYAGWDSFTPDPNEWDRKEAHACKVCFSPMDCHPDCYGPTSSIMAMGGSKRAYDHWTCPHSKEDWHKQALQLCLDIEKQQASPTLRKFLENDLLEIREKNTGPICTEEENIAKMTHRELVEEVIRLRGLQEITNAPLAPKIP